MTTNGKRRPRRPAIEVIAPAAAPEQAAAIAAALERFLHDTAPVVSAQREAASPWGEPRSPRASGWRRPRRGATRALGQLAALASGYNFLRHPNRRKHMAAVKIIELIGTSSKSSDDAVQQALAEARTSLRNIKAVDLVSTGLRGENLDEWRAHVRVAFLVERVSE